MVAALASMAIVHIHPCAHGHITVMTDLGGSRTRAAEMHGGEEKSCSQ
jgi:hypothetical protein